MIDQKQEILFDLHLMSHRNHKTLLIRSWEFVFASPLDLLNNLCKLQLHATIWESRTFGLPPSAESIPLIWALDKKMTASVRLSPSTATQPVSRKQLTKWNIGQKKHSLKWYIRFFFCSEDNNATPISN